MLTNYHVIKAAEHLYITLFDGSNYQAEVVGADPENDLAVIRFDPEGRRLLVFDAQGTPLSVLDLDGAGTAVRPMPNAADSCTLHEKSAGTTGSVKWSG